MYYLIDGYNLLFRLCIKTSKLREAREKVIEHVNQIAALTKIKVILVFDGKREQGLGFSRVYYKDIEIIYTADGISADDFIIDMLGREKHPSLYKIITSDGKLRQEVKRLKALDENIEEFLKQKTGAKQMAKEKKIEADSAWHLERLTKAFEKKAGKEKDE